MLGLNELRNAVSAVASDIEAARERDPAARGVGSLQILATWPGVQAVLSHRLGHAIWRAGVPVLPGALAYATRAVTGVEIHPAARIGREFFIDHGSGVVIGETTDLGERVTIYQGVTLGGTGSQRGKRHPTVGDDVVIGAGAKLLGPVLVGSGAKVGANTVVIEDVPEGKTVVGNPGRTVGVADGQADDGGGDQLFPGDPIAGAARALVARVTALEARLDPGPPEPLAADEGRRVRLGGSPAKG